MHAISAAWGAGTKARSVLRAQKPWVENSHIGATLHEAASILLEGRGSIAAYAYLLDGPGHVAYLGPTFFTKFLYFIGYGRILGQSQPLILDRFVARGMNDVRGTNWGDTGWTAQQYEQYVLWAGSEVVTGPLPSEDEVEFKIWVHGKSL